ncbi:hypothetical protein SAMN05421790_11538 [Kroppenstedtia eburnea]|uniref:Uncharacterized protein n=1 Tax=Kroppenstedtia eburnea TaxID=714067 RepID=A0A1N7PWV9_9BACL|nr:hypothetical protein SAMN05421790_11538 [Kroppenstedtia eburnea]
MCHRLPLKTVGRQKSLQEIGSFPPPAKKPGQSRRDKCPLRLVWQDPILLSLVKELQKSH